MISLKREAVISTIGVKEVELFMAIWDVVDNGDNENVDDSCFDPPGVIFTDVLVERLEEGVDDEGDAIVELEVA